MRIVSASGALVVAVALSQAAHEPVVRPGLGATIDQYLTRLGGVGFSGAVIVAKAGEVVLEKGYGLAVDQPQVPVTPDTVLQIGSITKQFTAAAILKLEMQGRLQVTDPITKYFDQVPVDKAGITLHHLLTHSAGLASDYGSGDFEQVPLDEFVRRIFAAPLHALPGTAYEYSNAGFSLLAAIVEKVSHQPWEAFLRQQLFIPAGMRSTGCILPQWSRERLAHGYAEDEDRGSIVDQFGPDGPAWNLRGNGGIVSTVGDMYRWHLALAGETILSNEEKRKAYTPYIREGPNADSFYGYGWALFTTPRGTRLITHNGGDGVSSADFLRFVDDDVVIYLAANRSRVLAWQVSPALANLVFGGDVAWPPATVPATGSMLQRLTGTYALPTGGRIVAAADRGRLMLSGEGQDAMGALAGVSVEEGTRLKQLTELTTTIVAELAKGNDTPLREAFAAQVPPERLKAILQRATAGNGGRGEWRVLGSTPGPEGRSWTVVTDPHGSVVYYIWSERRRLLGIRPARTLRTVFYPESSRGFVAFNPETGKTVRVAVAGPTDKPDTLAFVGAGPDIKARRSE